MPPLLTSSQVQWLEQQVAKRRTKRDLYQEPTDPKFPQQWYLVRLLLGSRPRAPAVSPSSWGPRGGVEGPWNSPVC